MKNNVKAEPLLRPCTGCQMCAAVCPKGAIQIKEDADGFLKPFIQEERCISCGICRKYCYRCNQIENQISDKTNECIATQARDPKLIEKSSSGGIAHLLAYEFLLQGYQVIGVGYDYKQDRAVSVVAKTASDLDAFHGSKYMQSYTLDAWKEIIQNTNQKYAVFGTPCHIYALGQRARKNHQRERFIFVDIFCHGCPSSLLWKKYIQFYKKKLQIKEFTQIEFRSKQYGWHEYCNVFYGNGHKAVSPITIKDSFFSLFFDDYILNEACYSCETRSAFMYTDIRLGDFWGDKYDQNTEGISAVVLCTQSAKKVWKKIQNDLSFCERIEQEEVVKEQSYGHYYAKDVQMRRKTFDLLKSNKDMDIIFQDYIRTYSLPKYVKYYLKMVVYILPQSLRMKIKKMYHARKKG